MFAADGTMLHCFANSALMDILEKLHDRCIEQDERNDEMADTRVQMKVSIVDDGMAEVQALDKPDWIKACSHLADHFTASIFEKYRDTDELRLTFDRLVVSCACEHE